MTGASTNPASARESVRQHLAGQWRESVSVVWCARGTVSYRVAGRSRSGARLSRNRLVRGLRYLAVGVYAVVALPVVIVLGVLDDLGIQVPGRTRRRGRIVAMGAEGSEAVRLADTLRGADGSLWICWSRSHVAVAAGTDGQPSVLWHGSGSDRPKVQPLQAALTWPDGAELDVAISDQERDHIRRSNGRP